MAITGTGFSSATAVKFGSVNAASFTINSDTSITAPAPAATAAGAVHVTVTAGGNTSATSSADQFTYNAPTVTGVSPANVPLSGGAITITGTNFVIGNTSFSVGGTSVGGSCTSSTTCTATAGAKAAGAASVVATTGSVSSTTNGTLTYLAVPTISAAFSPTSVSSGGNATLTLTVTNPNTGTALSGIAVGSATLPTNLTGSGAATTCGGTATLSGNALSLSGGALSASASCTVTLTVSSTNAATYNYTSGTVSASGPITLTGSTATTPTGLTVAAAPTLGLAISNGTLTQGQTGTLTVTPSATVANTSGTLTFAITLPANTSLSSSSGTGWSCSGTSTVSCTSASVITAGNNGNPLTLNVAIGASASVSLSFSGTLSGGGAAASANATDSATVVQTPASMAITSGNSQSAGVSTAFASALQVRVLDAASVVIPSSPVTFTAPGSGASGTFSGSGTNSISANTNASGIATSGTFTANSTAGGPYTVSATAGSVSQNFSLTNTAAAPTVAAKSASVAYNTATPIDLTASVSGVHSSLTVSTAPAHGTTSIAGDVITYTPTTGYYGSDSFAYTATGPGGTSGAATVTLTVATPAAPTVAAKSASVAYNTATPIDLSASVSGVHSSLSVSTAPAHGNTSIAGDVITYTPTTGYYGSDSFGYTATGPGGTSAAATVTLTVATPAAPTVAAKSASIAYNTATPIDLSVSVSGVHSSLTVSTAPAHGTTSIAGDVITYTPTTGYYGSDSFGYTATGPGGTSGAATVTLTVATPAAPTVAAKSASIAYNTATPIDLSASVSGVHSSLSVSTAPAHGTTSIAGDVITYTPTTGYYGSDSFGYTATGPGGTSSAATVTLTVATPAAPTVAAKSASIAYDTATPIDLSASVSGVHGNLTVSTAPAHGTTSIAGDVITYTPTTGYYGSDSFAYTAAGPGGTSGAATVTLTVATPAAPTVAAKSASIAYNTATPIDLTASVSGVHSSLTVSTAPAHGTTSIAGDVITYTPTTGYYGSDSFGYTATGPGGTSGAATVTLTVATPAAPTVAAKSASIAYNTATPIDLTASVSGVHSSLSVSTAPAHGTTSIAGDVITYTPTSGYYGSDSFGYTATGPGGTSSAATVTLTVATPAAPTVAAKSASVAYNTATLIDLTASVSGVHSSLAVSTAPAHGTTSIAGDVITYTPTTGYYGSDSFAYTATGPGGTSGAATVTLTVATPAAPTVAAKSASVAYNTATPIDLTASVSGVHSSLSVSTAPAHGTTSIAGDVITYTPTTGYYGSDSFAYTATGPGGTSSAATVTLTVATPAAPTVAAKSASIAYNTATPIDLTASVSGVHSSLSVSAAPAHGTTSIAGDVITYTPTTGYYGSDSFGYTATGPGGTSSAATITLTVATPAAPTVAAKSASVAYNTATPIDLTASVSGVHSSLTVSTAPAHGTTSIAGDVITYTPTTGYYGSDSFGYTATGPGGTSAAATVTLTVATPAAPTVAAKSASVAYNTATPIDLTASVSGMHSNLTVSTVPAHGTTSIAGDVITYTPTTGYYGSDSFGYTATGPGGTSAAATVTLTVATPALAITQTSLPAGQQDVAYSVALTASGGTAPYTFAVTGGALPSGLALAANGTLAGTPTANGTFSVTITASDSSTGDGPSRVSQTFSVQIALPAPPVVHDTSVAVTQTVTNNQPASIDLSTLISGNVTDVTIATPPQHGTVVIQRSGASFTGVSIANPLQPGAVGLERSAAVAAPTVPLGATVAAPRFVAVYTPTPGYQGPDRFTFTAVGPGGSSTFATVDITVKGTPPVAANLVTTTDQNQPVTVDISSGAVGGPFTQAAIVSVSPANSATATLIADGTAAARTYRLQIQPSPRFSGTTVVTYTIGNTFGMSPAATITVTVKARPDPSADPVVRGLIDAQDTATRDFARAQIENFGRRNEQLHGGGGSTGNNPIGITLGSNDGGSFRRPGRFDGIAPETALKMEHANEVMGAEGLRVSSTGTLQPGGAPMGMPGAMGLRTPAGARNGIATGAATSARTAAAVGAVADETGDTGPRKIGSVAIWSGGAISIGTRDATTRRTKLSISSSGLSAGADVKLSDDLTVGAGGGVGEERTRVGTADAGHLTADTWIGAAYGSFRPTPGAFIDGVLGYGNLSFNTRRAALGGSLAVGHRNGSMLFGSLSAGIDQSTGRLSYSLYGRAEYLNAKLRAYAETGAGVYSLTFDPRTLESLTSVAGGRATLHLGAFAPRARLEWRHEFNQASPQLLDYADLGGPSQYSITTNDWLRDELQFEIGLGLNPGDGWTTGIDLGGRGGPGSRSMTLRLSATKKF